MKIIDSAGVMDLELGEEEWLDVLESDGGEDAGQSPDSAHWDMTWT